MYQLEDNFTQDSSDLGIDDWDFSPFVNHDKSFEMLDLSSSKDDSCPQSVYNRPLEVKDLIDPVLSDKDCMNSVIKSHDLIMPISDPPNKAREIDKAKNSSNCEEEYQRFIDDKRNWAPNISEDSRIDPFTMCDFFSEDDDIDANFILNDESDFNNLQKLTSNDQSISNNLNISNKQSNLLSISKKKPKSSQNVQMVYSPKCFLGSMSIALYERVIRLCAGITCEKKMVDYLQLKITGKKQTRFNKQKLHFLYQHLAEIYGWRRLSRDDKRNKNFVFKKLFFYKFFVVKYIEMNPQFIAQILLLKGEN